MIFKNLITCSAILAASFSPAESETLSSMTKQHEQTISNENRKIKTLKAALEARIQADRSIGYGVAVVGFGKPVSFGVGMTKKDGENPINKNSIFEIGSITKTFTGILLADMVIRRQVKLDDPVNLYLPEGVRAPSQNGKDITLLDLATHRSGLPSIPNNFAPTNPLDPFADYNKQQLYDFLNTYMLPRDIGAKAEYSNLGMGLLGHILSLKSGKSYEVMLQDSMLRWMNMDDTYVNVPSYAKERLTTGHAIDLTPIPHWNFDVFEGAGAIKSTPHDMLKYLQHTMEYAVSSHTTTIARSQKFQNDFGTPTLKIGFGWLTDLKRTGSEKRDWVTWHNGGTGGYRSYLGFNKKRGRGVFIVANAQDDVDAIGRAVLEDDIKSIVPKTAQKISFNEQEINGRIGTYPLAPNFNVVITEEDNQFYLQATNQPRFPIFPTSKDRFFLKVVEATIDFSSDDTGRTILTLNQGGQRLSGKKK